MTEASANENPTPRPGAEDLTPDDIRLLLSDALMTVRDLAGRLPAPAPAASGLADFSEHAPPPPMGAMHSARDSETVAAAMTSIRASAVEVGFAETIIRVVDEIAAIASVTL